MGGLTWLRLNQKSLAHPLINFDLPQDLYKGICQLPSRKIALWLEFELTLLFTENFVGKHFAFLYLIISQQWEQREQQQSVMAAVCDKSLYDSKILEAIIHVKNISKKKPTIENIHKYLVKHQLTLDKVLPQVLLDNLVEENNLEIYESNSNEICYNVKKNTHVIEDQILIQSL